MAAIPVRTTIFEHMSAKAAVHDAANLGQGFPDSCGPDSVRAAAARAIVNGPHHYPRMRGTDELRAALADFYAGTQGLRFDPASEIVVTSGGTEALASAILALVEPGDGVLIIEPAYDAYGPLIRRAGGQVQAVRLQPPGWRLTRAMLEAAVTPATKLLIVNDPANPTGRMFDAAERAAIRDVVLAHDLLIVADEVWEEVRPAARAHVSLASLPELRERVVKIGSAGKVFEVTGWKIGWLLAAAPLAARVAATHQFLTFTSSPALQHGVAHGLTHERSWLEAMRTRVEQGRARLAEGLTQAGYVVLPSEASWFLCIDLKASGIAMEDFAFCETIVERFGVAAIPVSAFYDAETPADLVPRHVVRLCHAKSAETTARGLAGLTRAREALDEA